MHSAAPWSRVADGAQQGTLATLSQQQPYGQPGVFGHKGHELVTGALLVVSEDLLCFAQQGHEVTAERSFPDAEQLQLDGTDNAHGQPTATAVIAGVLATRKAATLSMPISPCPRRMPLPLSINCMIDAAENLVNILPNP